MTRPDADRPGPNGLSDQELLVAELLGRYIERREHGHGPHAQDLVAVAAEHGDAAVNTLCFLLACYEAGRAHLSGRGNAAARHLP